MFGCQPAGNTPNGGGSPDFTIEMTVPDNNADELRRQPGTVDIIRSQMFQERIILKCPAHDAYGLFYLISGQTDGLQCVFYRFTSITDVMSLLNGHVLKNLI